MKGLVSSVGLEHIEPLWNSPVYKSRHKHKGAINDTNRCRQHKSIKLEYSSLITKTESSLYKCGTQNARGSSYGNATVQCMDITQHFIGLT